MEFRRIWTLRGPNLWARFPVFEVELDLGESRTSPGFHERLSAWLPEFAEGHSITTELSLTEVFERLALWLQVHSGSDVKYSTTRTATNPDQKATPFFRVIVEYEEELLARPCIDAARDICLAALREEPYDVAGTLRTLRDKAHEVRLGPSTAAIVRAARKRGIPVQRMNEGSLVQLGYGARQHRICAAETDRTSAIAEAIAQDKQLTRSLLRTAGVPVPYGRPVNDAEDAWAAAQELGGPVVVKPRYGNHGRGVATNLSTREQVIQAYNAAREESSYIVVETYAPGVDYRALVIGGKLIAVALREPAHVIGDGVSTINQLIEQTNRDPRRSDGHATVLSYIKIDTVALGVLGEQSMTPDSIPPAGQKVLIRRNANLSTGGTATDVTDQVHPQVALRVVDATLAVGLDIAGVDVVVEDISKPLEPQHGVIVEVNAGPGLRMHLEPSAGKPRPVGEAVVDTLFRPGQTGRIPIVAVTGVNGKTTTTRLIAHILRQLRGAHPVLAPQGTTGLTVGMTCTDGTYINGRRTETRDCSGPQSARAVLMSPRIDVAVLEKARGGILREGLGFDFCDVGVVTNIGAGDHLGLRGIETLDELARVKRVVVEAVAPTGTAVLNADDPLVVAMAAHCPGKITYFGQDEQNPVLAAHRRSGHQVIFIRKGEMVLAAGDREEIVISIDSVPATHQGRVGFQIDNVLAAVAAAWALQIPLETIRTGLQSFSADAEQVPGRFNVLQINGATVVVDYAHNPSAVAALVAAVERFPQPRRTLVYSGTNRRDHEVVQMGQMIGDGFDRVVLYQDRNNSDRTDGELNAVLRRGLEQGKRVRAIEDTTDEFTAINECLQKLHPDEIVVIGVEAIEPALELIQSRMSRECAI